MTTPTKDILWIDIETVPLYPSKSTMPDDLMDLWTKKYCKDKPDTVDAWDWFWERASLFPERSKIVCVSLGYEKETYLINDIGLKFTSLTGDEEEILTSLNTILDKSKDRFVLGGYNLINFDIPFIRKRMIINRIQPSSMIEFGSKKPRDILIVDVMKLWQGSGGVSTGLETLCAMFMIPCKEGIDGKDIKTMYRNSQQPTDDIIHYCQSDVYATYQCYCRINNPEYLTVDRHIEDNNHEKYLDSRLVNVNRDDAIIRRSFRQHLFGDFASPLDLPIRTKMRFLDYLDNYEERNKKTNEKIKDNFTLESTPTGSLNEPSNPSDHESQSDTTKQTK